jgi:hypothetical protein
MSRLSFSSWLATNAGVISVLGALVIFFSWTVTNTLGQRYSRLKQSVETAESTFRLYTTLHELRASLKSVAMETVYAREAAERLHTDKPIDDPRISEVIQLRRSYSHARLSAHQINELMDFASQTLDFSGGVGTDTGTAKQIRDLHAQIYEVYRQVRDRDRAAEVANSSIRPDVEKLRPAIEEYIRFVREDAIPRVGGFYEAIVDASNLRREEGRAQLAHSKRSAAWATRGALVLYIVGSLLALGGQYLDKVYKKRAEAEKARQVDAP